MTSQEWPLCRVTLIMEAEKKVQISASPFAVFRKYIIEAEGNSGMSVSGGSAPNIQQMNNDPINQFNDTLSLQ